MNTKTTLSFFGMLLVIALVGMGVIKIWMPEAISDESFVKIVVTFGLLTIGAMAMSFLSKSGRSISDDNKSE